MRTTPASKQEFELSVRTTPQADPISVASLRLPQDFGSAAGVRKILTTVPFRKPAGQAFVRVHPEWRLQAAILQLKEDGENYIVAPSLYAQVAQEVRAKMVYTGVT